MSYSFASGDDIESGDPRPNSGDIWFGDIGPIADHVYLTDGTEVYHSPVVDAQAIPNYNGYYIVTADGCVFAFGKAKYFGSLRENTPKAAISKMMLRDEFGYALVDEDGNVYPFGDFRA